MVNQLQNLKEQLFDAPKEVKESFNSLVRWFDLKVFHYEGGSDFPKNRNIKEINVTEAEYAELQEFYWYVSYELLKALNRRAKPNWEGTYNVDQWYIDRANKWKQKIKKGSIYTCKYYTPAKGGRMSGNDAGYVYDCWYEISVLLGGFLTAINRNQPSLKDKEKWYY